MPPSSTRAGSAPRGARSSWHAWFLDSRLADQGKPTKRLPLTYPPLRSSQPDVTIFPKKNAPWRRVVRTVRVSERQFYDELECGHRESHDHTAKKRRCRTCADPTFPGIAVGNADEPVVVVEETVPNSTSNKVPAASSPPIPLVLTVAEVAKLLRLNLKTVYAAAASGEIPGARRIGRRFRFYGPALAKWLETGTGPEDRNLRRRPSR